MKSREYYQGANDYWNGKGLINNPYPPDTQAGKDWHEGNLKEQMRYGDGLANALDRREKDWEW